MLFNVMCFLCKALHPLAGVVDLEAPVYASIDDTLHGKFKYVINFYISFGNLFVNQIFIKISQG